MLPLALPPAAREEATPQSSARRSPVIQRKEPFDMSEASVREMVAAQKNEQDNVFHFLHIPFTTVGFEYEFAQFDFSADPRNPLKDVTHLELIRSEETMPFSNLPFSLETDARDTIELVTPPFLIRTVGNRPIPDPAIVRHVNEQMKTELLPIAGNKAPTDTARSRKAPAPSRQVSSGKKKEAPAAAEEPTLRFHDLLSNVIAMTGFRFPPLADIRMKSTNINAGTPTGGLSPVPSASVSPIPGSEAGAATSSSTPSSRPSGAADTEESVRIIPPSLFKDLKIKPSSKPEDGSPISEQINIATDAFAYDALKSSGGMPGLTDGDVGALENQLKSVIQSLLADLPAALPDTAPKTAASNANPRKKPPFEGLLPPLQIFLNELARNLSQCVAVPAISYVEKAKQKLFEALPDYSLPQNKTRRRSPLSLKELDLLEAQANLRSHVKDVDDVWLKDTLVSFALGLFRQPEEYELVIRLLIQLGERLNDLPFPSFQSDTFKQIFPSPRSILPLLQNSIQQLIPLFEAQRDTLLGQIGMSPFPFVSPELKQELRTRSYPFPAQSVPFGEHALYLPGVRHDTFIHPANVNRIPSFSFRWLHVVEIRKNSIERLEKLAAEEKDRMDSLKKIPWKELKGEPLRQQINTLIATGIYTVEDILKTVEDLQMGPAIYREITECFYPDLIQPITPVALPAPTAPRTAGEDPNRVLQAIREDGLTGKPLQKKLRTLILNGICTEKDIAKVWEKSSQSIRSFLYMDLSTSPEKPVSLPPAAPSQPEPPQNSIEILQAIRESGLSGKPLQKKLGSLIQKGICSEIDIANVWEKSPRYIRSFLWYDSEEAARKQAALQEIWKRRLQGEALQKELRPLIRSGEYTINDISKVWKMPQNAVRQFLGYSFAPPAGVPIAVAPDALPPGTEETSPEKDLPPQIAAEEPLPSSSPPPPPEKEAGK